MPNELNFLERQVLEAIQSRIIPWLQNGAPLVMLNPPPFIVSRGKPNINIREMPADALPALHGIGGEVRVRHWHDKNLNAYNIPYWGCVMEGEADLVVGITEEMSQANKIKPARWVVSLPVGTLFWMPPGVPITMSGLHWERPHPEKAHSRIFWMHVTPTGANCHFCSTSDGKHWEHPFVFTPSQQLWPLAQRISHELEEKPRYYEPVLEYSVQLLLLHTMRGMYDQPVLPLAINGAPPPSVSESGEQVIQQALDYIDERFKDAGLTATDVARHVHLSATHLGRLFRKHLQSSVRQIIINKRFEKACQLLEHSEFNIRQIGVYCGYGHTSTFIAAFEKRYEKSPLAYRREHHEYLNEEIS